MSMEDRPIKSTNIINSKAEILSGTLIKQRYLVQRTLGQGGCGRTYLVLDRERFDKPCVLKEFFPSNTREDIVKKSQELFEREARVLNSLEHPQIPQFFGWFEEHNRLFLVQDFIDGQTYADLLQQGQTLSESEIIEFLNNLLPVLDYIHSHKIIHRDISPDNIMLPHQKDKPVLIDFGVVNNQQNSTQNNQKEAFIFATTVGKMGYSPIEQIRSGKCYPSSDLYALAVTVIVLLTGKKPQDLMTENGDHWIWQKYVNVSHNLQRIIDKMLQRNPQERYQSALEVIAALNSDSTINHDNSPKPVTTFVTGSSSNSQNEISSKAETVAVAPSASSSNITNSSHNKKKQSIIYLCILLAIGGITLIGIQSPKIDGLCQVFDNCELEPLW